jgi:DNA-binding XRE family transcriptional regulator
LKQSQFARTIDQIDVSRKTMSFRSVWW